MNEQILEELRKINSQLAVIASSLRSGGPVIAAKSDIASDIRAKIDEARSQAEEKMRAARSSVPSIFEGK